MKKLLYTLLAVSIIFSACAQDSKKELINKVIKELKKNFISFPVETDAGIIVDMINQGDSSILTIYHNKDMSRVPSRNVMIDYMKNDNGMKKSFNEGISFIYRYYNAQGDSIIREEIFTPKDIL